MGSLYFLLLPLSTTLPPGFSLGGVLVSGAGAAASEYHTLSVSRLAPAAGVFRTDGQINLGWRTRGACGLLARVVTEGRSHPMGKWERGIGYRETRFYSFLKQVAGRPPLSQTVSGYVGRAGRRTAMAQHAHARHAPCLFPSSNFLVSSTRFMRPRG